MRVNKSLITFQQTGAGTGSVTSVAMTVPTGLTISGSPITSSGTLAVGFASGVALPPSQTGNAGKYLTTDGTNLSWGNISGSISGTANYVPFFATSSTLGTSPLYYDGSYYMAIGTTTTGTGRLQIYSTNADEHLQLSGTAPSLRFTDTPTSATYNQVIAQVLTANNYITNSVAGDFAIANASGGNILFGIGTTEMMRIFTSTGNVNIGGSGTDTGDKLYVGGVIKGTGQLKLTGYTSTSSFTGTAAGYLAFDSSGNILSAAAPSGTNIYNSDGTLTGNRTILSSQYWLRLQDTGISSRYLQFLAGNNTDGQAYFTADINSTLNITSGYQGITLKFNDGTNSSTIARVGHNNLSPINDNIVNLGGNSTRWNTVNSVNVSSDIYKFQGTNALAFSFYTVNTGIHFDLTNKHLNIFTNGSQNAKIFSTGNWTIGGTTDAGYKIDVQGTSRFTGTIQFGNSPNDCYLYTGASGTTGIQLNRKFIVVSNGADNAIYLDGGNGTSSIARIYMGGGTGTQPLCINGNGREAVFGSNTSTSSGSALIRMESTTKGFLPPRMTNAERTAITSPAVGLIVYCTDTVEGLYVYKSGGWTFII